MKNVILALGITLLTLNSCSDNDKNPVEEIVLVKKMIETDSQGKSSTTSITYSGNKIASAIASGSDNYKTVYTYTGDVITKEEEYDTTTNSLTSTNDYTYLNGVLSTSIKSTPTGSSEYKTLFIHNTDGAVNVVNSTIITATKKETITSTAKYTYTNGNLIKTDYSTNSVVNTTSYEYDSKNNPLKNILGIKLLLDFDAQISINNWTKSTEIYGTSTYTTSPIYTYNSSNYPIRKIDGTTTTQYFY